MTTDPKTAAENLAEDIKLAKAAEQWAQEHDDELDEDGNYIGPDPDAELEEVEPTAEEVIASLETKLADAEDKALRAAAELQNYRRRADRELANARKFGAEKFAKDVIAVADNLRMAISSVSEEEADGDPKLKNMRVGVVMTEKELLGAFEKNSVEQVVPQIGDDFDHNLHQAMTQVETSDIAPGKVAIVMTAAYRLNDRLLKPAMVGVAKAPADDSNSDSDRE